MSPSKSLGKSSILEVVTDTLSNETAPRFIYVNDGQYCKLLKVAVLNTFECIRINVPMLSRFPMAKIFPALIDSIPSGN